MITIRNGKYSVSDMFVAIDFETIANLYQCLDNGNNLMADRYKSIEELTAPTISQPETTADELALF